MDFIGGIIYTVETLIDTKPKRHLLGGIMISVSLLFGGLAGTILTMKEM